MIKGYILLALSIVFELIATNFLKMSDGFEHVLAFVLALVGYGISFYLLSLTLRTIPLSVAYAIWAGAGTVLTAALGILIWGEAFSLLKGLAFALIISGVVLLNLSEGEDEATANYTK